MTDLFVEKNHVHIDEAEMVAILSDLQELGLTGEARARLLIPHIPDGLI